MNNFIIKNNQTKDNQSFGYFNDLTTGLVKCLHNALPVFSFNAENATTDILTFKAKKINKFGEVLESIELDELAIKLNLSGNYYYYDKNIITDLSLDCGLWYLEITNISATWNSQIFEVLSVPATVFTLTDNGTDTEAIQGVSYTVNYLLKREDFSVFSDGSYNITLNFGSEYSETFTGNLLSGGTAILTASHTWMNSGLQTVSFIGDANLSFQIDVQPTVAIEFGTTSPAETVSYQISATRFSVINIIYSDGAVDSYTGGGCSVAVTKSHVFDDAGTHYAYLAGQNTDLEILNPITNNIIGFNFNSIQNDGLRGLVVSAASMSNFAYCTGMAGKVYSQNYTGTAITEVDNSNCVQVQGDGGPTLKCTNLTSLKTVILGGGEFSGGIRTVGVRCAGCTNLETVDFGNVKLTDKVVDFQNCTTLHTIINSNANNIYSYYRLQNCTSLLNFAFGTGVNTVNHTTAIVDGFYIASNLSTFSVPTKSYYQAWSFWPVKVPVLDLTNFESISGHPDAALILINSPLTTQVINVNGLFKKIFIYTNSTLTNITFASVSLENGCTFDIKQNALTQSVVDAALQLAVNSNAINGIFNSSGGTNSAPSTAGLVNVSTLQDRGWTVTVNS